MNRTYKLSALWMMCLMLISSWTFTACDNGDSENTNQYKGGVSLNAFGPCPVARGGELRFLGSGMDQVTGVVIPGTDEITDIKVVSKAEIRVTVPQTAEVGLVVLHTPKGDITTKTPITYSEPISLDDITPATIKPGAVLTIAGEYLNLIKEVLFAEDVVVLAEDFTAHSRKEIKLVVPEDAQTGKIILSDGQEIPNWIYSENELVVTLPSVEEIQDLTNAKPGDAITVTGKDLDLVKTVEMPNGETIEFEVEEEELTFILPENVSDGTIVMIPASGVKVTVATVGVAVPTDLVADPATELRASDVIVITGVNMELVTSVTFPGMEEAVELTSQSATEIKVIMPEAATSGELVLNTASGNTALVAIETLKPEVSSYAEAAVPAGENVTLIGKNLDLVTSIIFGGNKTVEVSPVSATELTVKVPVDAETGELTVVMANGEEVTCSSLTVNKPEFCYIPVLPNEDEEIHAGKVLLLDVENGDKLTGVQVNGVDVQFILEEEKILHVSIPNTAANITKLTLISSNGEIDYSIDVIPAGFLEIVAFEGSVSLSWSDGGRVFVDVSAFDDVANGSFLKIYFEQTDNWGQIQINNGSWGTLPFADAVHNKDMGYITTDNLGDKSITEKELVLTGEILNNIRTNPKDGIGLILQGSDFIVSKVSIITKGSSNK